MAVKLLVTGTTGGIGGAVRQLAESRGWEIIEVNRADFAEWRVLDGLKDLDAVVFATGFCPVKALTQLSDDELMQVFDVNCGHFVRLMRRLVKGRAYSAAGMKVVAISSVSAVEGWAGGSAYCASKGALSAVCRALDAELKPKRISVCALEPRYVRTKMFDACAGRMGVDPSCAESPEDLARKIVEILEEPAK